MTYSQRQFFYTVDLLDVTIAALADGDVFVYDAAVESWVNSTLSDAGIAAESHTHNAGQITTGVLSILRGGTGSGTLNVPVNYTATGSTIRGNLEGIDNALGNKIEDLSSFDTGDLAEGTNLYFTDERVDDRVNALLTEGTDITLTYDDGANTLTIDASGGASAINDLSDVTITSVSSGELLTFTGSVWENQTLAEAGVAAASHTHATGDITSGTFADARISESSVTQHEAALTLTESQISDLGTYYSSGDTLRAANGSAAAPSISFASDTNTGIYGSGSDVMYFVAGGSTVGQCQNVFGTTIVAWQCASMTFNGTSLWSAVSPYAQFQNTNTSSGAAIRLKEGTSNGSNYVALLAANALSSNLSFTLPTADGTANQVMKTDGSGALGFVDNDDKMIQIDWVHEAPTNDSYVICLHLPDRGGTLEHIYYKSDSGTCTANVTIDGTSVTSWSSLSVSSTEGNAASTGADTFSGGETLRVVITSASSADMVSLSIKGTFD